MKFVSTHTRNIINMSTIFEYEWNYVRPWLLRVRWNWILYIHPWIWLMFQETDIIIEQSWESHERKTFKTAHSWYLHSRSLCRKVKNLSNTRRIGLMTVLIEKSTSYLLWLSVLEPIICLATLRIFERFFLSQLNHLGFRLIWFCVLLFGESLCIERCPGRTFDRETKMNPDQTVHNL